MTRNGFLPPCALSTMILLVAAIWRTTPRNMSVRVPPHGAYAKRPRWSRPLPPYWSRYENTITPDRRCQDTGRLISVSWRPGDAHPRTDHAAESHLWRGQCHL